jgi:hypothetical protein
MVFAAIETWDQAHRSSHAVATRHWSGIDGVGLDLPNRFDVYYGMADDRIGVARMEVPETLPGGSVGTDPKGLV